eukprot:1145511-Pelagomonas_calceolata.AAC.6
MLLAEPALNVLGRTVEPFFCPKYEVHTNIICCMLSQPSICLTGQWSLSSVPDMRSIPISYVACRASPQCAWQDKPALNVLGRTVESLSGGVFTKKMLIWAVSLGVGVGMAVGRLCTEATCIWWQALQHALLSAI